MFRLTFAFITAAAVFVPAGSAALPADGQNGNKWDLKLWYKQPAKAWTEALPVGNGRLGAMVFGETENERIQLNEQSVWSGGPYDPNVAGDPKAIAEIRSLVFGGKYYEAQQLFGRTMMGYPVEQQKYQSLGNLWLTFPGHDSVSDYGRELDLDQAVARVQYQVGGVHYKREIFSSPVDQVIIVRLTADRKGAISFSAKLYGERNLITYDDNYFTSDVMNPTEIVLRGKTATFLGIAGRVKYEARLRLVTEGGTLSSDYDHVIVNNADAATLVIAAATNFVNYHDLSADPGARVLQWLSHLRDKPYAAIFEDHVKEHRRLFRRMAIDLGETPASSLPTDERVKEFSKGNDPQLAGLYLQFGRYLLISCSRPDGEPANLQGLWNQDMNPWWESKYTTNINLEMNYWPAEACNISECATPLFDLVKDVSVTGATTAQVKYGAGGWVLHQNTDLWRAAAPMDGPTWGTWPTGGAWLLTHVWDHYLYTGDIEFLKSFYPIIKSSVQFFQAVLAEEPQHHWLVTCPSMSPENFPQWGNNHRYLDEVTGLFLPGTTICAGPAMDMEILRALFDAYIQSSEILRTDKELRLQVVDMRKKLAPLQVGKDNELQEWLQDWKSLEPEHRHLSHLWGLYPGDEITPLNAPKFAAAAEKSLVTRGDGASGWSMGWKINLWARLLNGEHAYLLFKSLITENTFPNLFSRGGQALQVDGNFGGTAGIAEMILQSHSGQIALLPAIPKQWPRGSVTGMRARGGFEVDIEWKDGKLTRAIVHSLLGNACKVRYGGRVVEFKTEKGKGYSLNEQLNRVQ